MQARLDRLTEMSEADGTVTSWLLEPRRPLGTWYLRVLVEVPGYGGHEATFEYEEWYEAAPGAFLMPTPVRCSATRCTKLAVESEGQLRSRSLCGDLEH